MANTPYENYLLENEIEDQFKSQLDLMNFVTVDTTLEGVAGMKKTVHKYSAVNGCEKLTLGQGNSKQIEVSFTTKDYDILLAQSDFRYFDEELKKDPMIGIVGAKYQGTDLFNTINADIYAEFLKLPKVQATALNYEAFVDAVASLKMEQEEETFALICPLDVAKLRKALKDDLKYVDSTLIKTGYIGSVNGVAIYQKKDAEAGKIVIATKKAVTSFIKSGTEVEQERNANTRQNDQFARKYYVVACTNDSKGCVLTVAGA